MTTYYLGEELPVFAVFLYAKNERADLSAGERKALANAAAEIERTVRTRKRR